MQLLKVEVPDYRGISGVSLSFDGNNQSSVFPVISQNGGGKTSFLQFVFTLLHCSFRKERLPYLESLMRNYDFPKVKDGKIASFTLNYEGVIYTIDFIYRLKKDFKFDFDNMDRLRDLRKSSKVNDRVVSLLRRLKKFSKFTKSSERLIIRSTLKELNGIADFYIEDPITGEIDLDKIDTLLDSMSSEEASSFFEIEEAKGRVSDFLEQLEYEDLQLISSNFVENVLLVKTDLEIKQLEEVSSKVYFAAPSGQLFHFFNADVVNSVFTSNGDNALSYSEEVENASKVLNLFCYDLSFISTLLDSFHKASSMDFSELISTGKYGDEVMKIKTKIEEILVNKTIQVSRDFANVSFVSKESNEIVSPTHLSFGELKRLSIFVWLTTMVDSDSIILFDEIDNGLHPNWQNTLVDDLKDWNNSSTILLATHSPHIIANTPFNNLIIFKRDSEVGGKNTALKLSEAPIESDVNSIVQTIMGGDYIPNKIRKLREEYLSYFEEGMTETEGAKKVKNELLVFESENSSFFQELEFRKKLGQ